MTELRRFDLLDAAVSAVRALGDEDPRGYFDDFIALRLENSSARDRPLWESLSWAEVETELGRDQS